MVYIYYSYLSEEEHRKLLEIDLPKFPKDYQEKIKRYRRWQDAQLSLLGRILLFKGIEQIYKHNPLDKVIKHTKFSKPYFEDNFIHFNISHSGEIVVCALSDESEIGIDIEIVTDIEIEDFKSQMSENEFGKIVISSNSTRSFFDYWTQKEAVIKAQGEGLSIPLSSFEVSDYRTMINGEKFFLKEIKINDKYKCYVSQKMSISDVTIKNI
ncbi:MULTISPECIES: 4'-phosphopantetheinyl transferase family protein [Flavobacterium]|uniref:4'-phosphopantetheinyl transferase superfamily protein n=1 Tax=Flavobacterium algoritolerans TaxID=3041254 RepID=A0ABT6VCT4_9FLAO|nr:MULTISPECIES: 4'-phosphopantetheinyl transferase superfamily protein [Flavobacterium]MDI5888439.1 4'-phosphopantetheinyl transferase superfamily protein [Flavobacterium yafengii]MDI5896004.1 4'-phosphopantetheinyl transferase superfamily protein [Flavobacterium algoritolerans]